MDYSDEDVERNFFMHSIYRTTWPFLREFIYDEGRYLISSRLDRRMPLSKGFTGNYAELALLNELTEYIDDNENTLTMFDNELPHDPRMLQLPDYTPEEKVDNSDFLEERIRVADGRELNLTSDGDLRYYHTNMAWVLLLCDWFDCMRIEGVWDNSRIIIASDHGAPLNSLEGAVLEDGTDIEYYSALLMVKDFDASGFEISDEFMCNADVPWLALKDLLPEAVNPYTGNALDGHEKKGGIAVNTSNNFTLNGSKLGENGYAFDLSDGKWYRVNDDIFEHANWQEIEEP